MEAFGIDPEYIGVPDGNAGVDAVLSGRADLCLRLGIGPALVAIAGSAPLRILAGANMAAGHAVFASDPEIRQIRDLEGRTVGIGSMGALAHQLFVAAMEKWGGDHRKVSFVSIGNIDKVFSAVADREIDVGLGEVDSLHLEAERGVHIVNGGRLWEDLPEFTNQGAFATLEAMARKREVILNALAASALLYRYLCSDASRQAYLDARRRAFPDEDARKATAQWEFYRDRSPYPLDLLLEPERLAYLQRLNRTMGLQQAVLPFAAVADLSLATEGFARASQQQPLI